MIDRSRNRDCRAFLLVVFSTIFAFSHSFAQISPPPPSYTCEIGLYSEGFETGIPVGWDVMTQDYSGPLQLFAPGLEGWFLHSGPTATAGTGPNAAFEGMTYVYCEGNGPVGRNEAVTLTSPVIALSSSAIINLSFYINLYGPSASIAVSVLEGVNKTQVLAPVAGNIHAGPAVWEQVYVDLSNFRSKNVRIQFEAIKPDFGGGFGDISIDNVQVCGSVAKLPTLGEWSLITLFLLLAIFGTLSVKNLFERSILNS